jgi:hypothetical protein
MAGGTDGNLITYDASGDPAYVATGSDGQVLTSTGAGSAPAFEALPASGITMIDQYRLTNTANYAAGTNTITGTYERNDTAGAGLLGTGMSVSSGVFSFPATGIYLIDAGLYFVRHNVTSRYNLLGIRTTQDGSNYSDRVQVPAHVEDVDGQHANATGSYIFDVTSTSTHKVVLVVENAGSITLVGDTAKDRSWIRFVRLGDT